MHLWLLRHGDALHPAGTRDAERTLSPLGKQQARRIGSFIARRSHPPVTILTSPYTRAAQTAAIVAGQCGRLPIEETENLLSNAHHPDLIQFLNARKEERLLLVGHEPLMSAFTSLISAGHAISFLRFSPCTLALVRYSGRARPDGGTLELLVPPESLMRASSGASEKRP